jgi:trehalose 6-phosphate synthase
MSTQLSAVSDFHRPERAPAFRPGRCIAVSGRLPVVLSREEGAAWKVSPAGGPLIAALTPVLRERKGIWIGWPGVESEQARGLSRVLAGAIHEGFSLRPVMLSAQERRQGFAGFAGEVLWPVFHDMTPDCGFPAACWQSFLRVNRKFARVTAKALARGTGGTDMVWVHDPVLMNLAVELRRLKAPGRTAFFLHLPFPSRDQFLKLPWRDRLLAGLLAFDQLGFQTERDLESFLAVVEALAPASLQTRTGNLVWMVRGMSSGRPFHLRAGAFPVGVDARALEARAARPEIVERSEALRASLNGRQLVLGVDRIDRSKGIPEKLRAFAEALGRFPELHERVTLVQVVLPSRDDLPRHAALRTEIERLVGEINGSFGRPGWVPVHYVHRELQADELLAYFRAADVALVTPLKAGMNLMAKEFCAVNPAGRGVLVLSEFAGAAAQLATGALLVNPFDVQSVARALRRALGMKERERAARMRRLREEVRRHDVSWWASSFLAAALGGQPDEIPGQDLRSHV